MKQTIIVGVTSSIAAYKSVQLVSDLIKKGYDVEVIMSKNATQFITPLTFSTLTKHKTYAETFDRVESYDVEHISLAQKASCFIIAPATANVIAKVAHGLADDMLTTTFLACDCPKIIAPAMNTKMYENPITQDNLAICKSYGMHIVHPVTGRLACSDVGNGKLADIPTLIDQIEYALVKDKPLLGKKILVSAGPTREAIDPVRFITNHSSGKMGYAIARCARNMGAEVTLISGPVSLPSIPNVHTIDVESANEMFEAFKEHYKDSDYIIKSAAVSDYRSSHISEQKRKNKSETITLDMVKNPDILAYLGEHKTHQKICGFAMETENVIENAKAKLQNKNCDMLVVNNLFTQGAGFQNDTNVVSILSKDNIQDYPKMSKDDLAKIILEILITL